MSAELGREVQPDEACQLLALVGAEALAQLITAAGHTDYQTTQRHVDSGLTLRGQRFGEPHPKIP